MSEDKRIPYDLAADTARQVEAWLERKQDEMRARIEVRARILGCSGCGCGCPEYEAVWGGSHAQPS